MDDRMKELYARQKTEELREQALRIERLEARTRAQQAQEQFEEVSGLRALHDRIGEQVKKLRSSAAADAEQTRAEIQKNWNDLKSRLDAAQKKDQAADAAQLDHFKARIDQLNAGIDELLARARQGAIWQRIEVREAVADLQAKRAAAAERRQKVEAVEAEADEDMERALDEAAENLQRAYDNASRKVEAARASESQPHA